MLSVAKKRVAVFDLNQTLYIPSSKESFYHFLLSKQRSSKIYLVYLRLIKFLGKLRLLSITTFKEDFYRYLDDIPPDELHTLASQFWQQEFPNQFRSDLIKRIRALQDEGVEVLIITGSLDVYTRAVAQVLPIETVISTRSIYIDGKYDIQGIACKGSEKIRRLEEHLGYEPYTVVEAYSDEREAILKIAECGYLIQEGVLVQI